MLNVVTIILMFNFFIFVLIGVCYLMFTDFFIIIGKVIFNIYIIIYIPIFIHPETTSINNYCILFIVNKLFPIFEFL